MGENLNFSTNLLNNSTSTSDNPSLATTECPSKSRSQPLKRNSACDSCYLKKLKCNGSKPTCDRCERANKSCTYNRVIESTLNSQKLKRAGGKSNNETAEEIEMNPEALATLISSFLSQHASTINSQQTQNIIPNAHSASVPEFPILSQLFGSEIPIVNQQTNYQYLFNPSVSRSAHATLLANELPYSLEVIDDMVTCFFTNCTFWPFNFIHPQTFIRNRYYLPRSLLAAICARGSEFSKYTTILKAAGEDPAETLYQLSKRTFDADEACMETVMTAVNLGFYAASKNRMKSIWYYSSVLGTLLRILKIYEDPDILESQGFAKFSPIEKEVRRRVLAAVKTLGHCGTKNIFHSIPVPTVKEPLPYHIFEELTEDVSDVTAVIYRSRTPTGYYMDAVVHESLKTKEVVMRFNLMLTDLNPKDWDVLQIMIKSLKIQQELIQAFDRLPEWLKTSFWAPNLEVGLMSSHDPSKIPWLAPHFVVSYFGLRLLNYRFVLTLLSAKFTEKNDYKVALEKADPTVLETFMQAALSDSWEAHNKFIRALKDCIIGRDPKLENIYPGTVFSAAHSAIFACTMSDFGMTPEQRRTARFDFEFLKTFFTQAGRGAWKFSYVLLEDLKRFDQTPHGNLRLMMTQSMWTTGFKSSETHMEVFGADFSSNIEALSTAESSKSTIDAEFSEAALGVLDALQQSVQSNISNGASPSCDKCGNAGKVCSYKRATESSLRPRKVKRSEARTNTDNDALDKHLRDALLAAFQSQQTTLNPSNYQPSPRILHDFTTAQEFPILHQLFGQNEFSHLFNPSISPSSHALLLTNELPYSVEVIDDMIKCFFQQYSFWPLYFIHPQTVLSKRYHLPRALLAVICARGSEFSKYTPMLRAAGEDPAETLFHIAKHTFDVDDPSIETMMTAVHLALYAASKKRMTTIIYYASVLAALMRILKIYEDPDVLESQGFATFTPVEKEVRRRILPAVNAIGHCAHINIFETVSLPSVRGPLAYHLFEELSDNENNCSTVSFRSKTPAGYYVDAAVHEALRTKAFTTKFNVRLANMSPKDWNLSRIMIDALNIQRDLKSSFDRLPNWLRNSIWSPNLDVGMMSPQDPTKIPWLAPHFVIFYHGVRLINLRFVLTLLSAVNTEHNPYKTVTEQINHTEFDAFMHAAIEESWDAHSKIVQGLKDCILRLDPTQEKLYPITIFAAIHSAVFACVMADTGSTPEKRRKARFDFEFLKKFFAMAGNAEWTFANLSLAEIIRFDETPHGENKLKMTQSIFMIVDRQQDPSSLFTVSIPSAISENISLVNQSDGTEEVEKSKYLRKSLCLIDSHSTINTTETNINFVPDSSINLDFFNYLV
ncbi:hypothetical protein HK098_006734 [Nowakowskiella sp. JEL0407]|nr:hypothetical protein HK098_006734 [Nowakowskiella sp. JEL0407]